MAAERARRVLVAEEARERARGGPVVHLLRRGLHLLPHRDRRRAAVDAGLGTESMVVRVRDAGRELPQDRRQVLLLRRVGLPEHLAHRIVVDGRAGRVAEEHLAEELRMIGHRGEVERAVEMGAPRLRLVVVGEHDRGAAGEGVGVGRADARPEDVGVGREVGVDVEVPEVRSPQRVEARARLAGFGPLPRRGRGADGGADQERDADDGGSPHWPRLPQNFSTCRAAAGLR